MKDIINLETILPRARDNAQKLKKEIMEGKYELVDHFDNEYGERFIVFYEDDVLHITGHEFDWKPTPINEKLDFMFSPDEQKKLNEIVNNL